MVLYEEGISDDEQGTSSNESLSIIDISRSITMNGNNHERCISKRKDDEKVIINNGREGGPGDDRSEVNEKHGSERYTAIRSYDWSSTSYKPLPVIEDPPELEDPPLLEDPFQKVLERRIRRPHHNLPVLRKKLGF